MTRNTTKKSLLRTSPKNMSTRMAACRGQTKMEPLEERTLLSLLGLALEYPLVSYDSTGVVAYIASTGDFQATATPLAFKASSSLPPKALVAPRALNLDIQLDSAGQLIDGGAGSSFRMTGKIDVNGDSVFEYSGTLLTGTVIGFGWEDTAGGTDYYDVRLVPTGGSLMPFFGGKDIGIVVNSENSSFGGDFSADFAGGAKGNIGPIEPLLSSLDGGMTATIGFWNNKNGQALITSLNGGRDSTALGNWLAAMLPNLYGAQAGANNLVGKSNSQVAKLFKTLFSVKGQKLDAQVLGAAIATYVTDTDLAGTTARKYGFIVSSAGTGAASYNIGCNGAAFGVANNSIMTVSGVLQAADDRAVNGVLYGGNTSLRNMANSVFDGINNTGDI